MLLSELMADIRFPSVIIATGERLLIHYDLFAISKVLPTVPKIRFSCIFCTPVCVHRTGRWFPLRRSEDTPVEHPGREPGSTGQGGHSIRWVTFHPALDKSLW